MPDKVAADMFLNACTHICIKKRAVLKIGGQCYRVTKMSVYLSIDSIQFIILILLKKKGKEIVFPCTQEPKKNIRKLYHIIIDKSSGHWEQPLEYSSMLYCLSSKYLLKNTCRIQGKTKRKGRQVFFFFFLYITL